MKNENFSFKYGSARQRSEHNRKLKMSNWCITRGILWRCKRPFRCRPVSSCTAGRRRSKIRCGKARIWVRSLQWYKFYKGNIGEAHHFWVRESGTLVSVHHPHDEPRSESVRGLLDWIFQRMSAEERSYGVSDWQDWDWLKDVTLSVSNASRCWICLEPVVALWFHAFHNRTRLSTLSWKDQK